MISEGLSRKVSSELLCMLVGADEASEGEWANDAGAGNQRQPEEQSKCACIFRSVDDVLDFSVCLTHPICRNLFTSAAFHSRQVTMTARSRCARQEGLSSDSTGLLALVSSSPLCEVCPTPVGTNQEKAIMMESNKAVLALGASLSLLLGNGAVLAAGSGDTNWFGGPVYSGGRRCR